MKVSAKDKDIILARLCDGTFTLESVWTSNWKEYFKGLYEDYNSLNAILSQFERYGLISRLSFMRSGSMAICIHLDAVDLLNAGGFYAQEKLLKDTLEKLELEINQLKKTVPDKIDFFTGIGANIATCLALLKLS